MILLCYTLLLTGGALLIQAIWGGSLTNLLTVMRQRRQRQRASAAPHALGQPLPVGILPLQQVVAISLISAALTLAGGLALHVTGWAFLAALGLLAGLPMALVALLEARMSRRLDLQAVDAATQVASTMQSGVPLLQAIQRVLPILPAPLRPIWQWVIEQTGAPVLGTDGSTRYLTLEHVARSAAIQTPNRLLMLLLEHLAAASVLAQADARDRMQAAADALHSSRLRMAEVRAKLTHARVSGMMVLCVGLAMGIFLAISMPEQFAAAFAGPLGPAVMVLLAVLYGLPIAGIFLLSRVPALDI